MAPAVHEWCISIGKTRNLLAWALFDLANTFFAVAMLSFYFPLWVVEEQGAKEMAFSVALGLSMACVAVIMPFCGALSDRVGKRMRFLRWTTYGCAVATALIGLTSHLGLALLLFGFANLCYQLGTIFYDALLWDITDPERLGFTSGIGAAFGYLGSALGMLLLWPFVRLYGNQGAFIPSAFFFLLFALPSFLMIREKPRQINNLSWRELISSTILRLSMTFRSARALRGLWRYLWAAFFSLNAINTVLVFMAVFTRRVLGFTQGEIVQFFLCTQMSAIAGSLFFSRFIPRWGAKRTLEWIWGGWMLGLLLVGISSGVGWLWIAGPVLGFCLGATWATSRVLIMQLSPKDQLAEMFGLAGLFARASSILGPLLWAALVWDPARYRPAMGVLSVFLLVGLLLLHGVPEPEPG